MTVRRILDSLDKQVEVHREAIQTHESAINCLRSLRQQIIADAEALIQQEGHRSPRKERAHA